MNSTTMHMIGHAHIDPVWLWRWQEGYHEAHATFRSALDRMKEFPEFKFVASSAAFYAWVEESDPAMFAEIQQRVAEGRWQLAGGWWVEPDCNIPGGEAFVRHGLYGQRYFLEKFGQMARVGFNVDSFGHSGSLPQILSKSGLPYYNFLRPQPHEKGIQSRLFWWQGSDGTRVLAYRIPFEYLSWPQEISAHVERCAAEIKAPVDEGMCFYGVGNHGGGPTIANIESIIALRGRDDLPDLPFSTPEAFFDSAAAKASGWTLPVVTGDVQKHAPGCYAAHSGIKQWNRQAEHLLVAAEKWSALASWVQGEPYPDLEQAWKSLLFSQFHDILAGTSLPAAYDDARNAIGETLEIAGRALNRAQHAFAWNVRVAPEDGMKPLVVFNPHTWPVQANIEIETYRPKGPAALVDDHDQPVPWQLVTSTTITDRARLSFTADLPALGYRVYRLRPSDEAAPRFPVVQASDNVLDNGRLRLEIDSETGYITRLYDQRAGIDFFSGDAAQPVVIDDPSDTWSHNIERFDTVIGAFRATQVKLAEHGPAKSVIRVFSSFGPSRLIQDFTMYPDRDQIDVRVTVDWHEQLKALKLRFPVNVKWMRVTKEESYGFLDVQADGAEMPMQRWVDVSGIGRVKEIPIGLSLLNDAKYSVDVNVRDIGLTVLRSPAYAHHIPAAINPNEVHPFIDQGMQQFTYTLLPHTGGWETAGTVRRAAELNQPPSVQFAAFHPEGKLPPSDSFIEVTPEAVMVTALKQAEDGGDLIVRALETTGAAVSGTIRLPKWGRVIEADFAPGELKTFRVPRDAKQPVTETNLIEQAAE